MIPFLIVIPTYKRCDLLDRTLRSLAECCLPPNLVKVIVAENGIKSGADLLVKKYDDRLPLTYQYTEKPNKSNALNEILRKTGNEFIIFFDDDVRVHPDILLNYAKEVGDRENGFFLCGRIHVDWEEHPIEWLVDYLPSSVTGWHFNDEKCEMRVPKGVGSNWGAFAIDMREAGGFDERRGPGSGARGQEADMMERLLNRNIVGYYLPECKVWHFVPKTECSPEWTLSRTFEWGVGIGIRNARVSFPVRAKRIVVRRIKLLGIQILIGLVGKRLDSKRRFHYEYLKNLYSGILRGLKGTRAGQSIIQEP